MKYLKVTHKLFLLVSIFLCMLFDDVFASDVYQYKDEEGSVHYSNVPSEHQNVPSKNQEKSDTTFEKYEVIVPPQRKTASGQKDKLDYFNYLNSKLEEIQQWRGNVDKEIARLERNWKYYAAPNSQTIEEMNCKLILEDDAYVSTTVPNSYYSTTYTSRVNPAERVYCKELLRNKAISEKKREQDRLVIESRLQELYSQRSQLIDNEILILQELNK